MVKIMRQFTIFPYIVKSIAYYTLSQDIGKSHTPLKELFEAQNSLHLAGMLSGPHVHFFILLKFNFSKFPYIVNMT